jgi:hypothetical protein
MTTETEDKPSWERELSCTFCGPGTWSVWEVVTDEGVFFVCNKHHVEMSEAKIIRLERILGKKIWKKIPEPRQMLYEEDYSSDWVDFKDISEDE